METASFLIAPIPFISPFYVILLFFILLIITQIRKKIQFHPNLLFFFFFSQKCLQIMKRKLLLMLVFIACTISLSAQITREQANTIVLEHLQNTVTPPYLLYVNVNSPGENGITLFTYNEEKMKVEYACWAYYLNENPEITTLAQHRYLFVKENDGNLLEIITSNDLVPENLSTQWTTVPLSVKEKDKKGITIYPNPTTGELRIKNCELRIDEIEVFDIYGRKINSKFKNQNSELVIDISHLQSGIYFVKIFTEQGAYVEKIIKNY